MGSRRGKSHRHWAKALFVENGTPSSSSQVYFFPHLLSRLLLPKHLGEEQTSLSPAPRVEPTHPVNVCYPEVCATVVRLLLGLTAYLSSQFSSSCWSNSWPVQSIRTGQSSTVLILSSFSQQLLPSRKEITKHPPASVSQSY